MDIASWDSAQVAEWFESLALDEYEETILGNDIDGELLLALGKEEFDALGIHNAFHQKKIMVGLKKFNRSAPTAEDGTKDISDNLGVEGLQSPPAQPAPATESRTPAVVEPAVQPAQQPRSNPPQQSVGNVGQYTCADKSLPFFVEDSRTVFLMNVDTTISDSDLTQVFHLPGSVRSVVTDYRFRGIVIVCYYDIREARGACALLSGLPLKAVALGRHTTWAASQPSQPEAALSPLQTLQLWAGSADRLAAVQEGSLPLEAHFCIPIEQRGEEEWNEGTLVLFNVDSGTPPGDIQRVFGQFGQLMEIRAAPGRKNCKFIEYYDVRSAAGARTMHRCEFNGLQIDVKFSRPHPLLRSLTQRLNTFLNGDPRRSATGGSPYRHGPSGGGGMGGMMHGGGLPGGAMGGGMMGGGMHGGMPNGMGGGMPNGMPNGMGGGMHGGGMVNGMGGGMPGMPQHVPGMGYGFVTQRLVPSPQGMVSVPMWMPMPQPPPQPHHAHGMNPYAQQAQGYPQPYVPQQQPYPSLPPSLPLPYNSQLPLLSPKAAADVLSRTSPATSAQSSPATRDSGAILFSPTTAAALAAATAAGNSPVSADANATILSQMSPGSLDAGTISFAGLAGLGSPTVAGDLTMPLGSPLGYDAGAIALAAGLLDASTTATLPVYSLLSSAPGSASGSPAAREMGTVSFASAPNSTHASPSDAMAVNGVPGGGGGAIRFRTASSLSRSELIPSRTDSPLPSDSPSAAAASATAAAAPAAAAADPTQLAAALQALRLANGTSAGPPGFGSTLSLMVDCRKMLTGTDPRTSFRLQHLRPSYSRQQLEEELRTNNAGKFDFLSFGPNPDTPGSPHAFINFTTSLYAITFYNEVTTSVSWSLFADGVDRSLGISFSSVQGKDALTAAEAGAFTR